MLEVRNVDLLYGAAIALRGVSLDAQIGETTCVLGRNGVGKTSLMRAITGAHAIAKGSITWEGEEISKLALYDRAKRGISWVPQGRDIFPLLTVRENLETGFAVLPRGQHKVPDEIFELFPILKSMLGRRGGDLSGGQQQQLAIGRALVMKPRLLVLDEPVAGMTDSETEQTAELLREINKTRSVVVVEHDMAFVRALGVKVTVLHEGSVLSEGSIDHVSEDPKVVEVYLGR